MTKKFKPPFHIDDGDWFDKDGKKTFHFPSVVRKTYLVVDSEKRTVSTSNSMENAERSLKAIRIKYGVDR